MQCSIDCQELSGLKYSVLLTVRSYLILNTVLLLVVKSLYCLVDIKQSLEGVGLISFDNAHRIPSLEKG